MLIARCEWHTRYFGRRKYLGLRRWRPFFRIETTGGMCPACRQKFAEDFTGRAQARSAAR